MSKKDRLAVIVWSAYWGGLMAYAYTYLNGWRFIGLVICMVCISLLWALAPKNTVSQREFVMDTIMDDLNKIMSRIELFDDPTAPESYRELIGDAHYSIEECISALNMANQAIEPTEENGGS